MARREQAKRRCVERSHRSLQYDCPIGALTAKQVLHEAYS